MMPATADIPVSPIPFVFQTSKVGDGDSLYFSTTAALGEVQRQVLGHWMERVEPQLSDALDDDIPVELNRIVPKQTYAVRVRITHRKRGTPLPYDVPDIT